MANALKKTETKGNPATRMLLTNTLEVLGAFQECSDEIQHGILKMAKILHDPDADQDEKDAAAETMMEALYPQYVGDDLGIDSRDFENIERQADSATEESLDAEEDTFAEKLAQLMADKNMTQKDLAEKIGVGQPAIANMLNRQCRPQRRTIQKLASALSVDPKTLWPFSE